MAARMKVATSSHRPDSLRLPGLVEAIAICLAGQALMSAAPAHADVFEIDNDGRLERLDQPTPRLAAPKPPVARSMPSRKASLYRPFVESAGSAYAVSPALIDAIARTESGYNQQAVSKARAVGIMQLMPGTAKQMRVDASNAADNIRGGTAYLRYLLNRYDGDLVCTIAAYNAGPGNVSKQRCVPNFPETMAYVERVMAHLSNAAE